MDHIYGMYVCDGLHETHGSIADRTMQSINVVYQYKVICLIVAIG